MFSRQKKCAEFQYLNVDGSNKSLFDRGTTLGHVQHINRSRMIGRIVCDGLVDRHVLCLWGTDVVTLY